MSNAISPQLLTSPKLYFEITSQTQSIAHASSRLFSGRIPELEWAAEIEPIPRLNPSTHNFDNDVTISIFEQIKRIDMTVQRKKELLLRKREIFWQSRLRTLQPTGLNKRIG